MKHKNQLSSGTDPLQVGCIISYPVTTQKTTPHFSPSPPFPLPSSLLSLNPQATQRLKLREKHIVVLHSYYLVYYMTGPLSRACPGITTIGKGASK
jgi:hypothetical protein